MPSEVRNFAAVIPAGTPIATPVTVSLAMPPRIVRSVRVRVPPGANGLVGWRLASGGQAIIPWNAGAWFVWNNEWETFDLENQLETGAWEMQGYNLGANAHTVYLTFLVDPPQRVTVAGVPIVITAGDLYPPPPVQPPPPPPDVDGYAAGRANAIRAVEAALDAPLDVPAAAVPATTDPAWTEYQAAKAAALAALAALVAADGSGGGNGPDGYAAARRNALVAVEAALGMVPSDSAVPVPAAGTQARQDYATGKAAAVAAVAAITR